MTSIRSPQAAPPRRKIDLARAWRAIQILRKDPERIDQTFEVMIALDGGQMEDWFQRLLAEPDGPALVAERPSLLDRLADRASLRKLGEGSLARAYLAEMERWDHRADGLKQAKMRGPSVEEICPGPERQWFLERNGCVHDLLHTLTGYGQDWAGENCLLAFDVGLWPMRARVVGLFGVMMSAPIRPSLFVHRYVRRAVVRGKRAKIPNSYRWEEALARPLEEVRRELAIEPMEVAHPQGVLAGGKTFGPWRFEPPPSFNAAPRAAALPSKDAG